MPYQEPKLVQPVWRDLVQVADVDLVLQKMCVSCRARKRIAADVLVLRGSMFVGVADPELVPVSQIVKDASGSEEMMGRVGNSLRDGSESQRLSLCDGAGRDDGLLIIQIFIERQQETGALAVPDRAGHGAFVVLSPLRRFHDCKRVARIEDGVSEQEVQGTVIVPRSALRHDFEPGAPRTREAC